MRYILTEESQIDGIIEENKYIKIPIKNCIMIEPEDSIIIASKSEINNGELSIWAIASINKDGKLSLKSSNFNLNITYPDELIEENQNIFKKLFKRRK